MSFFGNMPGGAPRAMAFNNAASRSDVLGRKYQPFSNPFFDLASTYTPPTVKAMFGFCRHYHLTHGIINAINTKAAQYPITDLLLSHRDKPVVNRWDELMNGNLNYRVHQFEFNIDYFCLAAETVVTTRQGPRAISDLVGKEVEVLAGDGTWSRATFRSYGKQALLEIDLGDGERLLATPEHQWPALGGDGKERKYPTTALKGKRLRRVVAPRPEQNSEYWTGVRHGIVFGDGTLYNHGTASRVLFYTAGKKRELARFFEASKEHSGGRYVGVHGQPATFKELPAADASASYWYGFVSGFIATDGSVVQRDGQVILAQKPGVLADVCAQLPRIGMAAGAIRSVVSNGFGCETEMEHVTLRKQFMHKEDFVRSDQLENFGKQKPSRYGRYVSVKAVRETGRFEEVYCCVEPKTHAFVIEQGVLTGNCYGNAFISPSLPFTKILVCRSCNADVPALKNRAGWRYNAQGFWLSCPKCGQTDWAKPRDDYYPRQTDFSLVRWNPELVSIFQNEATGRVDYSLDFTSEFKNGLAMGRKDLVATTPQAILEAVKSQRTLVFDSQSVFHMRRPGLSGMGRWGIPLMMPVMKDAFFMQIMKKAQEAVLLTHLVPQVFLFPQPATAGADPFCVSPDTLIEVPGGVKPASEIAKGDLLRSHTGRWRRVEDVVRRAVPAEEGVYKITPYTLAGFPFTVSEEHPILATKNSQVRAGRRFDAALLEEPTFIETQELKVGDFVAYPTHRPTRGVVVLDAAEFTSRTATEEWIYARHTPQGAEIYEHFEANGIPVFKPGIGRERLQYLEQKGWDLKSYASVQACGEAHRATRFHTFDATWAKILGYYLSEGSAGPARVSFTFHQGEAGFIEELQRALSDKGYASTLYSRPENHTTDVLVDDVLFAEFMRGLGGGSSLTKYVHPLVAEASDDVISELLRCLYNGDGTILHSDDKGTLRVSLKTISPQLAIETRRLMLSLGHVGGVSKAQPKDGERAKAAYYQVYFNGAEAQKVAKRFGWTYEVTAVQRSERNAFIRDGYLYMRIRTMERVQEAEVIGYQMAVDRTFCVAGVATHNTTTSLADWRDHIRRELARQRMDPSYYGILPFPLGHQTIGENGKSLLLMPEIQAMAEHCAVGMGFPVNLIFGDGTYAGSSVNMRMLENFFLSNVHDHKRLVHWVIKHFGTLLKWPLPDVRFKAFRMADDLQRQALMMQQVQQGMLSETTMLSQTDNKVEDEAVLMSSEIKIKLEAMKQKAIVAAEIQGESAVVMAKYQAKAQGAAQAAAQADSAARRSPYENAMASPVSGNGGWTIDAAVAALTKELQRMPPDRQGVWLQQLQNQLPELAQAVAMQQGAGLPPIPLDPSQVMPGADAQGPQMPVQGGNPVDMAPQPSVLPPRRAGGA